MASIRLVRSSSQLVVHRRGYSPSIKGAAWPNRREAVQPSIPPSARRPLGPTLRANPYPEVTDLFCRLPLTTFFYRLEATNLGDLMR